MAAIDDIKWLREQSGAGVMDAKRAIEDAKGDRARALQLVEQRGAARAQKNSSRETAQGIVETYIHPGSQIGVLLELGSETDFVARSSEFKGLAHEIAMQVAARQPKYISLDEIPDGEVEDIKAQFRAETIKDGKPENIAGKIADGKFKKFASEIVLLEQPYIRDDSKTVKDLIIELSAKTKENIVLKRVARFQVGA
jgi:elongation factor Ts